MKIVDKYFSRPLLYDYIISLVLVLLLLLLEQKGRISIPSTKVCEEFAVEIGTVGFTISGFILTFIAILVTLRSGQIISREEVGEDSSPFKIFLASKLYEHSIKILKNGVISLILVSLILYVLKIIIPEEFLEYIFYVDIVCLIIIATTFLRCFYVLGLIIKMQSIRNENEDDEY